MFLEIPTIERRLDAFEWMDGPCSTEECARCLRDLGTVNHLLLAYRPTLKWLEQFIDGSGSALHIVDVGCGAGDMLRSIEAWTDKRHLPVHLTGIDRNTSAISAARTFTHSESRIEWHCCDVNEYQPASPVDVVISSLVAHHLQDDEIVRFLQWMEGTALRGWFVNDLERRLISYYSFMLLAKLMRWHPFVQHDGPVSILRSFVPADWINYSNRAGIPSEKICMFRAHPGRLCVSRVMQ
jgi:2-polyprenyl-3-methyl-5-hydroxy-6-metoxy-1,4-benzoquinol methylase